MSSYCTYTTSINGADLKVRNYVVVINDYEIDNCRLVWANVLSLSLRLGSGMNAPSLGKHLKQ